MMMNIHRILLSCVILLALAAPVHADSLMDFKAGKSDYQLNDAKDGKAQVVRLRRVHKEVVLHRQPEAPELDALSKAKNTDLIVDMDGAVPPKGMKSLLGAYKGVNTRVVWPSTFDETAAGNYSGSQDVFVFDFTRTQEISPMFLALQADYFPFNAKMVRLPGFMIKKQDLEKLRALRSFSMEIVLDKPLGRKQLRLLKKGYARVFKNIIVPCGMKKRDIRALEKLGNVQLTLDVRHSEDLEKDCVVFAKSVKKADTGLLVSGPFSPTVAAAISKVKNLKTLRVDMNGGGINEEFIKLLNRSGKK